MDQKQARKLEQELVKAIVEIVCGFGLRSLPLLPSHKTMQEMAKATVAVYEAEVDRPKDGSSSASGECRCPSMKNRTARLRNALGRKKVIEEKKMFGGGVFMFQGKMLVGVWKDSLIVRLGDEQAETALLEPNVKPFDIAGVTIAERFIGIAGRNRGYDDELKKWIRLAVNFVSRLPAK